MSKGFMPGDRVIWPHGGRGTVQGPSPNPEFVYVQSDLGRLLGMVPELVRVDQLQREEVRS